MSNNFEKYQKNLDLSIAQRENLATNLHRAYDHVAEAASKLGIVLAIVPGDGLVDDLKNELIMISAKLMQHAYEHYPETTLNYDLTQLMDRMITILDNRE